MSDTILELLCVKTDKGCFIANASTSYNRKPIKTLLFNGKAPSASYHPDWYYIEEYPTMIQQTRSGGIINPRYEIIDESLISEKLPAVIPYKEESDYTDNIIENLYTYKYDVGEVVTLNVRPDAEKVTVIYNGVTYEYTDFANPITIETTVGGVCNVLTETTGKELVASSFFVKIPDEESDFSVVGKTLGANSSPESNEDAMIEMESNKDLSIYFAIGLLALLLIEWGVQYREQY